MNVREIMTSPAEACTPETTLATAGVKMFEKDFGALPVIDESHRVVGMITDRDIAIAGATQGRPLNEITIQEVMSSQVIACNEMASIDEVVGKMAEHHVRRVPIVNDTGELRGIVSINELALCAERDGGGQAVTYEQVVTALKGVSEHWEDMNGSNGNRRDGNAMPEGNTGRRSGEFPGTQREGAARSARSTGTRMESPSTEGERGERSGNTRNESTRPEGARMESLPTQEGRTGGARTDNMGSREPGANEPGSRSGTSRKESGSKDAKDNKDRRSGGVTLHG